MAENEFEHDVRMLTIDADLPAAIDALKADGWELIPGVVPVAVYHIIRLKNKSVETTAQLNLVIDDSKIGILRNGKIVG